ncbi:eukaryotic translation initiation factor subunit [Niveomyces insectorum RCEF 264]|uniref:Eukaryotic translation initiation factor subunit n=1 Tax=Niveomyces insectorum RCEF 264 TaxID=1081102 RepID=A0A167PGT0_9HYPO|nr:eukaryotic translation initiation factor subunit [Niveomyces insectorum RCEF 264]
MTSPASTQNVPAPNSTAPSATASYASAVGAFGKAAATPVIATGSASPVVVGSSSSSSASAAPANHPSANHARSSSVSPLNGSAGNDNKPSSIPNNNNNNNRTMSGNAPAVPTAPAAANGNRPILPAVPAVINGSNIDHARKSSVTISATGPSGYMGNGGPAGAGPKAGLPKFGYESPAVAHSTPSQNVAAPIPIPGHHPRIPSPAHSPSPIPQPSASGGRPPTISQDGAPMKFGSLGGDGDRHMKHLSGMAQNNLPVGGQSPHFRRSSAHSIHSDIANHAGNHIGNHAGNHGPHNNNNGNHNHGNHGHHGGPGPGRGGFPPQTGRARGYNNSHQFANQSMGYGPGGGGPYPRGPSGQGRGGMPPQFQPRGMQPNFGPNSPQAARVSPAITPAMPNNGTPHMQAALPANSPVAPAYLQYPYQNPTGFPPPVNVNTNPVSFSSDNPRMSDRQGPPPFSKGGNRKKGARRGGGSGGGGGGSGRHVSHPARGFDPVSSKCAGPPNPNERSRCVSKRWTEAEASRGPTEPTLSFNTTPGADALPLAAEVSDSGPSAGPMQSGNTADKHRATPFVQQQHGPVPAFQQQEQHGQQHQHQHQHQRVASHRPLDDLSPASGNFDRLLTARKQNYPPQFVPQYGSQGMMAYPGYGQMTPFMNGPQQSPGPAYAPAYVPPQFTVPGPQAMSRNSSQAASERPGSSTGQVQTPVAAPASVVPVTSVGGSQKGVPSGAATQFGKPRNRAVVIKNDQGETVDFKALKATASPGPTVQATSRTPPVIVSSTPTPTPPPKSVTPSHVRTESVVSSSTTTKTAEQLRMEQVRNEFKEQVRKTAETTPAADGDKAEEEIAVPAAKGEENKPVVASLAAPVAATKDEKKAEAAPSTEVSKPATPVVVATPPSKPTEEKPAAAETKLAAPAAAAAPADEEDEVERAIREMEEAEAKRDAEEAAYAAQKKIQDEEKKKKADAERAATAAENDRKLREQEREMERLEEERERQRKQNEAASAAGGKVKSVTEVLAEKISGITLGDRKEAAPSSPDALANKLGDLKLTDKPRPALSPSSETAAKQQRAKPSALNLTPLNTKSVEPPQPSAALQSLKTARFLRDPASIMYPKGIQSPNPALNPAVNKKGNFKYDTGFLLQFKDVFVEKPSLDFDQQVKQLIGDGDGSTRSGARTPAGASSVRQNSRNNVGTAFSQAPMGSFNSKPLPPGTTSEQRFAMSSGAMPRPAVAGGMPPFGRPGGGFPGPSPMTRTPSSSMGGGMPNSPRQGSRSTRGNSRRDITSKVEAQAAKSMPLTQGLDVKPITVSATGWKPSVLAGRSAAQNPTPGTNLMDPATVQRKVKAALNKMTPEKFDKIADQILAIAMQSKDEEDGRTLRQVIQLTFEKATDEAHWASMYARFCKHMLDMMSKDIRDTTIKDKKGDVISGGTLFRKYLLNRCQEEFERGWKVDLPQPKEGESKETAMLSDEYYVAAAAKRRGLGLVQFIGELYKLGMLTERIMHECVRKLVDYETTPDEAEIESLSKLLRTVGANLDSTEKGRPMMDAYFVRIKNIIDIPDLPSRLKFMLMDIVDLRARNWISNEVNKGPKTLEEVRQEAEAAAAQKAAEAARSNSQRGPGGGRPGMGRDSRQFSYNQPPPNQVGMDDLRRLKGSASRIASSGLTTLGPTSMFASRSNSGRRNGPGGSFGRPGDDSGPASRTGTPPTRSDSNSVSHSNAFEALANVDTETPTSPPSTAASPALAKSKLEKTSTK